MNRTAEDTGAPPVLDRDTLDRFVQDVGATAFPALLVSFRREIAARRGSLCALLAEENFDAIEIGAHSLKATARTIGAIALSACAARIEKAALARNREALAAAGKALDEATATCLAALESLS